MQLWLCSLHSSDPALTDANNDLNPPVRASLVAQTVKNLPAMQETQVQSLGWEDPPVKEMTIHSSILA